MAAAKMFPDRVTVASLEGIPLYNADIENSSGIPAEVTALKDRIAEADGLLIATPEYNNSVPGVLKNAVDWLTRPADDVPRVFHDKPVALTGATPGGFGTTRAQTAWLPVFRTLRMSPWWKGRLLVSHAGGLVDDDGVLSDASTREKLKKFVGGFIEFCGS